LETRGADHLLREGVDAGDTALGDNQALELVHLRVQHLLLRRDHRRDQARVGPAARLDQGSGRGLEGDELHGHHGGLGIRLQLPPRCTMPWLDGQRSGGIRVWRWARGRRRKW
jgi:hypothetical protein